MSSSNTDLDEVPLSPVGRVGQPSATRPQEQVGGGAHSLPPAATSAATEAAAAPGRGGRPRPMRGQRLRAGLSKVGTTLQKFNLAKLIDDMEHDQELADHLETVNRDIKEELGRKELVREAHARCQAEIESHLNQFLQLHPEASYEDWIEDLHPDNVSDGTLFADLKQVDLRFYVVDSDHRMLWNRTVGEDRQVPPRTFLRQINGTGESDNPVDLLDSTSSPS